MFTRNKDSVQLAEINKWLKEYGGSFDNMPKFRLVWADDVIEKRYGEWHDYLPGTNVLLRRVSEVRQVKKYANHADLKGCYVIERLIPNPHPDEIIGEHPRLSYEPWWPYNNRFIDGNIYQPTDRLDEGEVLHPTMLAVQFAMRNSVDGPAHTAKWFHDIANEQDRQELAYFEQQFENENEHPYRNHAIIKDLSS